MQPSLEKIPIRNFQLSEAQPIIGVRHLHPERRGLLWNMHYGLEFGVVCAGKERRLFLDKSERDVEPGDVWFCGMWEPHGVKVVTAPCEVVVLLIWPPFLAQMYFPEASDFCASAPFNAPPRQRPRTSPKKRAMMIDFGKRLKGILAAGTSHQTLRLRLALEEMLLYVFESWPEAASWGRRVPSTEYAQINQSLRLVFEGHAFVSTDAAARACGMNRHKFSALFQSWMNISFADFSLRYRLHQAAVQLRETPEPIKNIAAQWGFFDPSHFYRVFMKHFGFAPQAYREKGGAR